MATIRKIWQTPALDEVSIRSALLGSELRTMDIAGPSGGPALGPVGPTYQGFGPQPGPLYGPNHAPLSGPSGLGPNFLLGPVFFGPPDRSDVRLKDDIRQVGKTVHGLPLYTFRYRGQVGTYEGVMAQDVLPVRPDAVLVGDDGFYRVDYAKLGIACRRLQ